MAEAQAGQGNAQSQENQQQQGQQSAEGQGAGGEGEGQGGEQRQQQAARTYTQEELDRILGKVRKNARYLGRKEAEAELRAQGASASQARETVDRQQQQRQEADAAPVRKEDESYEDFLMRKAEWTGRQASKDETAKAEKDRRDRTVAEQREKTAREFKSHAASAMEEIPDFAETIEAAEDVMISQVMGEAIQEAGKLGPRILYHLVKHPADAERIAGLSQSAAIREIGKIEARIESELAAKEKAAKDKGDDGAGSNSGDEQNDEGGEAAASRERNADGTFKQPKRASSRAPDPIEPVSARGASTSALPSDKDPIDVWMKKEQARTRKEGRRY